MWRRTLTGRIHSPNLGRYTPREYYFGNFSVKRALCGWALTTECMSYLLWVWTINSTSLNRPLFTALRTCAYGHIKSWIWSVVIPFAVKKNVRIKIQSHNFASYFIGGWNLVCHIRWRTETDCSRTVIRVARQVLWGSWNEGGWGGRSCCTHGNGNV